MALRLALNEVGTKMDQYANGSMRQSSPPSNGGVGSTDVIIKSASSAESVSSAGPRVQNNGWKKASHSNNAVAQEQAEVFVPETTQRLRDARQKASLLRQKAAVIHYLERAAEKKHMEEKKM